MPVIKAIIHTLYKIPSVRYRVATWLLVIREGLESSKALKSLAMLLVSTSDVDGKITLFKPSTNVSRHIKIKLELIQ